MSIFKYLFASVLAIIPVSGDEGDGWYPVEKIKVQDSVEEVDPSIWTLFVKKMGAEKFSVRFPHEPTYSYTERGELEIRAEHNGDQFILTVGEQGEPSSDLIYKVEGKWIWEHFVRSEHHFFHFKIVSDQLDSPISGNFFSSLFIEKNG